MGELLKKLWRDPAYFTSCVLGLAMFAGIYFAQPTGREWYERLALAASVAAGGGVAVARASRSGPNAAPAVLAIVGLSAFLTACGSLPTSSSATNEETKGGAFSGPKLVWNEPDGPQILCEGGTPELPCRLTDPPTPEESGVVGRLGEAIVGVFKAPLEILAGIGRSFASVAPEEAPAP